MPTISEVEVGIRRRRGAKMTGGGSMDEEEDEDEISIRSDEECIEEDEESNYARLMNNVVEEKEKLMETLAETQDELGAARATIQQLQRERDTLHRQLYANKPQVGISDSIRSVRFLYYSKLLGPEFTF